jgi:hypothetical protein
MADPPHVPDHVHGLLDWASDFWSRVKEAFSPRLSEQEAVDALLCFAIDVGVATHGEDKALEDLYIYNPSLEQRAQDCLVQAAAKKKMPFTFADVTAAILGATQRLEAAKANAAREEEALIRAVQKSRVAHAQVLEIEALLQCDEQGAFVHGVDVHAVEKLCHVMNYTDLVGWGRAARALRDSNGDTDAAYLLLVGIAPEPNRRITRGSSSSSGAASSSTDLPPRALPRRRERYPGIDEVDEDDEDVEEDKVVVIDSDDAEDMNNEVDEDDADEDEDDEDEEDADEDDEDDNDEDDDDDEDGDGDPHDAEDMNDEDDDDDEDGDGDPHDAEDMNDEDDEDDEDADEDDEDDNDEDVVLSPHEDDVDDEDVLLSQRKRRRQP